MENKDLEKKLQEMGLPDTDKIQHQTELKIPLLSYKKSSAVGLWLLLLPAVFALTLLLRYELSLTSGLFDGIIGIYKAADRSSIFTWLIPIAVLGLPLGAMIINFLAFCHFSFNRTAKEMIITLKYRPLNIAVFLFSFAVIIFFLLPDALP